MSTNQSNIGKVLSPIGQMSIILGICFLSEIVNFFLPFSFPSSVLSLIILLVLIASKIIKIKYINGCSRFLLGHMSLFFVPAGVSIMKYFDVLRQTWFPLVTICIITTPIVFAVTGWTVQLLIHIMNNKRRVQK